MYTREASGRDVICDVNNFRGSYGQGEEEGVEIQTALVGDDISPSFREDLS